MDSKPFDKRPSKTRSALKATRDSGLVGAIVAIVTSTAKLVGWELSGPDIASLTALVGGLTWLGRFVHDVLKHR